MIRPDEYDTETTRSIARLIFSGAAQRWPDLKLIFSHAGGTMPFLIERFEFIARDPAMRQRLAGGTVISALRRFHYDTAQASNPVALGALLKPVMGGPGRVWHRLSLSHRRRARARPGRKRAGRRGAALHRARECSRPAAALARLIRRISIGVKACGLRSAAGLGDAGIARAFEEVSIRQGDFAMAWAACQIQYDEAGICRRATIGVRGDG